MGALSAVPSGSASCWGPCPTVSPGLYAIPVLCKAWEVEGLNPEGSCTLTRGISLMYSNYFSSSQLQFCGPSVMDPFCDFVPLLELSCSAMVILIVFAFIMYILDPIFLSCSFHVCVFCVGRPKALSTCSTVLMSVTAFYDTAITVCVKSRTALLRDLNPFPKPSSSPLSILRLLRGGSGRVRASGAADVIIRPVSKTLERTN